MRTLNRPHRSTVSILLKTYSPLFAVGALGIATVTGFVTGRAAEAKKGKATAAVESAIRPKELVETIQALTTEEMASRQPGSSGDSEARTYIAKQMSEAKLSPGGASAKPATDKPAEKAADKPADKAGDKAGDAAKPEAPAADPAAFLQPMSLVSVRTRLLPGGAPTFKSSAATVPVKLMASLSDTVLMPGEPKPSMSLSELEVVFVGYGLTAPEFQWDDYKEADAQGKLVLILDGDPASDAKAFGGKARLHHGRWTNKFALAAKKGAAAAFIIVDDKDPAGVNMTTLRSVYGNNTEFVFDRDPAAPPEGLKLRGFITEEVIRRIMQSARIEYDDLRKAAEQRDFKAVRPKLRLTNVAFTSEVKNIESGNVVGVLPGSDPALQKEAVVYTAHFDGKSALDSAAGVAALLAMARSAVQQGPTPRTQIFAAVGAQTEYLFGARHLLANLPSPVTKVIAHVNLDGIDPQAPAPTVIQIGRGKSTIDAALDAAAKDQSRKVVADPVPELGLYYRSESMAFAKAGIPSLFIGWPDLGRYLREDYRQSGKEGFGASWSFIGGAQDAELLLAAGRRLAEGKTAPAFKKTDEFAAK